MGEIVISDKLRAIAEEYFKPCAGVAGLHLEAANAAFNIEKFRDKLELLKKAVPFKLNDIKILEIGSGFGLFVALCHKEHIDCYGVEPDPISFEASIELLRDNGISKVINNEEGEKLSYADNTFDLVVSFQVLEHVRDPEKVLRESVRVLKRGGYLYCVVPNYNSFWEGHYSLFWLPRFPRIIARLYLRLLGRDTKFLDSINYITPMYLRKILKGENLEILSWGAELWKQRLESLELPAYSKNTVKLENLVKILHKVRLISIVKYLGEKFELFYPIVLVARVRER